MDSTYVKEMERLANKGRVIENDGETFSSLGMKPVFYQPRPDALTVRTLTGLEGYLKANRDKLDLAALLVQVDDHRTVTLRSSISGKDRKRDTLIVAKFDGAVFPFGQWQDSESFIIAVNSLFLPSSGRDEVLAYVSRLKIEDESNLTDDGISQSATVKTGIKGGLVETAKAPSRTVLIPYRTFTEVSQPESEFVFRMKRSGEGGVSLALFEADGGAWKSIAMERIQGWLGAAIDKGIAVIA